MHHYKISLFVFLGGAAATADAAAAAAAAESAGVADGGCGSGVVSTRPIVTKLQRDGLKIGKSFVQFS